MERLADVVSLPARRAAGTLAGGARRGYDTVSRSTTAYSLAELDGWGRDPGLVDRVRSLSHLRWSVAVNGHRQLPERGGALIVVNARRFALAPVFAALSIGGAVGRPVRFAGRPDIAPVGPLMQRLGGLLTRPDEITGALRAGELVVVGAEPTTHPRRVGHVDHRLVGAAVTAGSRVFPTATASAPFRRSARVEIGHEIRPNRRRRGPLTELELADAVESTIQQLLDELGGPVTGTPLDWLPLSGMGGS
ncbi:MAG: hypothetical protein ACRDZZ_12585 [Ilumatobacteraceae bacterium]